MKMILLFLLSFSFLSASHSVCKKTIPLKEYKAVKKDYSHLQDDAMDFVEIRTWLRTEVGNNELYFDCGSNGATTAFTGWQVFCALGIMLSPVPIITEQTERVFNAFTLLKERDVGHINKRGRFTPKISADKLLKIAERYKTYMTEQHEFELLCKDVL